MCWVQVPPVGDWFTLEDYKQGVCDSDKRSNGHDESDDPDVKLEGCDAQQKESNGDLEHRSRYGVKHFAEEPVFERDLGVLIRDMLAMLTCSMDCAAELACKIACEEEQRGDHDFVVQSEGFHKHRSDVRVSLGVEQWKLCGTAATNRT